VADTDVRTHLEETLRTIARLRAEHHQTATPVQRAIDRMTALLGRPHFTGVLTIVVVAWISINLLAATLGYRTIDPPPFSLLGGAVSLLSCYMVVLILITQRREDQIAQHREQLILELVILSEQKTAKVIQLLEESRSDNPHIRNRVDREADDMAQPADPSSVLDAIKDVHADPGRISVSADRSEQGKSGGVNTRTSTDDPDLSKP
jgi:uncharacterized membrane protein